MNKYILLGIITFWLIGCGKKQEKINQAYHQLNEILLQENAQLTETNKLFCHQLETLTINHAETDEYLDIWNQAQKVREKTQIQIDSLDQLKLQNSSKKDNLDMVIGFSQKQYELLREEQAFFQKLNQSYQLHIETLTPSFVLSVIPKSDTIKKGEVYKAKVFLDDLRKTRFFNIKVNHQPIQTTGRSTEIILATKQKGKQYLDVIFDRGRDSTLLIRTPYWVE
jgi:hypothetical protein